MIQTAHFELEDAEEEREAYVNVRARRNLVALAVSLKNSGDVEVFVTSKIAREIAQALAAAASAADT